MLERELKFSSSSNNIPSFKELEPILLPFKLNPAKIHNIQDRYFDDAIGSLEKAGLSLRKRTIDNKRFATLKISRRNSDALFEREEIELEQKGSSWPEPIAKRVSEYCNLANLRKVLEFKTKRVSYNIVSNKDLAIVSFDKVTAKLATKEGTVDFFEVEIEAIGQTTKSELEEIATFLGKVIMLSKNTTNKLSRAKALLSVGIDS